MFFSMPLIIKFYCEILLRISAANFRYKLPLRLAPLLKEEEKPDLWIFHQSMRYSSSLADSSILSILSQMVNGPVADRPQRVVIGLCFQDSHLAGRFSARQANPNSV